IKYRLMDISIVRARVGLFLFVCAFVLCIPFWIGYTTKRWFPPTVLAFVFSSLGIYIYNSLRKQLESLLKAEQIRAHRLLTEAAKGMLQIWQLNRLLKLIVYTTVSALRVRNAWIYLFDEKAGDFRLKVSRYSSSPYPQAISKEDPLIKELLLKRDILTYEEASPQIKPFLADYSISVVIPAFSKNNLLGFMFLDKKRTQQPFSLEDILLFKTLSAEASLAIENSLLYERERTRLVDDSRRRALADMAPGASHQFNNRLATINSTAENILDLIKEAPPQEILNQRELLISSLKIISEECLKGRQITEAILYKAKAKLEFTQTDIVRLIQHAITLTKIRRSKSTLSGMPEPEFVLNYPEKLPLLWLSEATIEESFECMFNNSIDAGIKKHNLWQRGELKLDQPYKLIISINLKTQDNFLLIEILDNGIGIKPEDLPKIFTPYFTTKASSEKGIWGGVGLGLWVIQDYIQRHGGTITIESEYTQWTKLTIKLPLNFTPPK
ncbi:MAG: ATP-binding protein, partial [Candidatus Omnitrophica bacterium]|nr:ATP-binding protein [Candidatus Omnitrophota bacterium]